MVLFVFGGFLLFTIAARMNHGSTGGSGSGWLFGSREYDDIQGDSVPRVDRTLLEKLRLLELHYGTDEEEGGNRKAVVSAGSDSPPVVANVPEVIRPVLAADGSTSLPSRLPKIPGDILDMETCPERLGQPCLFLVPASLGEQETKAQLHLYQLGLLAVSLNRTLVLPNVHKSRLGTCFKSPFSFYYSPEALSALGIPTISQSDFLQWVDSRDPPPSAQIVSIASGSPIYPGGAIEIDSAADPTLVPGKPNKGLCLKAPRSRLDFSGYSPLTIFPPDGYHRNDASRNKFGDSVVSTLKDEGVGTKSARSSQSYDIPYTPAQSLVFNYELRFAMMSPTVVSYFRPNNSSSSLPLPFAHFPYARTWTDISTNIAKNLPPFVAIHWRTETLLPSNLSPCASALIQKLVEIKMLYPAITTVYLATDYPLEDLDNSPSALDPSSGAHSSHSHSGTFAKVMTDQHHAAFRLFLREFEKRVKGMTLTTFAREEARGLLLPEIVQGQLEVLANSSASLQSNGTPREPRKKLQLADLDPGLIGIIDKGIAIRAEIFLTGLTTGKNACSKVSSFTRQIIGAREEVRREQLGEMKGYGAGEEAQAGDGEESMLRKGRLSNAVTLWSTDGKGL